jgi:hypothetical protein
MSERRSKDLDRLFPWLSVQMSPLMEIEDISEHGIPDKPGVYILSGNTEYPYPWSKKWGKSKVCYIGKAKSLRKRIRDHKKHFDAIKNGNPRHKYYFPIYEYAYYHYCKICWKTFVSEQTAKENEHSFLEAFADYYGARPVANGQSAWPRLEQ